MFLIAWAYDSYVIFDLWKEGSSLLHCLQISITLLMASLAILEESSTIKKKKKEKNIVRLHMCGIYELLYLVNSELCSHVSGWNWCMRCHQIFLIKIYWYRTEKFLCSYSLQWNDVEPEAHGAPGIKIGIWLWHRIQWQNFHGLS